MRSEPDEIETGRIESGKKSKQDFVLTDRQFNFFSVATFEYHIVPQSQKPKKVKMAIKKRDVIVADDIRTYCPDCGRRLKRGWNFCAGCGKKF
jgi:hypoxanthine-guanine phosphoribosyltransferase